MPTRFELANAVRALSMDAVQQAKSGHPGAPMGMADIAEVLWNDFLNHNPGNPQWVNRDRFVLSNGHGSMLIYSLLHLSGYAVTKADLQNFRQYKSKTPGHPEYGYTPGIETTTGPLGQGLANAVGMAIAEKTLAAEFNKASHNIIDHYTYVFIGDGCLMEGISHEVASLAGTLKLGKLIVFYDDNGISIDGEVDTWFSDDTPARFEAYGWQVIKDVDGHDAEIIKHSIEEARSQDEKPTLICCKTTIGFGAPTKAGKASCHGAPLGDDEIAGARDKLNWPHAPFEIPKDIIQAWDARPKGSDAETEWNDRFIDYRDEYPELAAQLERRLNGDLPTDFSTKANEYIRQVQAEASKLATRKASQNAIEAFASLLPGLVGGSADLAGSNLTLWSGSQAITADEAKGNYIYYGVREFGMSSIMNGIALHGGFIPYGGTFLIFMEYARNAVRMSALMKQRVIYVFTHDSIGLGEDGPTHQPIEQLTNLRTTPNLTLWRPCDETETAVAWKLSLENHHGPSALALSRQGLPGLQRTEEQLGQIEKGGYVIRECSGTPELILIATGSEVDLALQSANELSKRSIQVRVVSMPSTSVFDQQSDDYKESVLPKSVTRRIAIEAGHPDFWFKYVGLEGKVLGLDHFGESAPAHELFETFGFTSENVIMMAESLLGA